MCKQFASQTGTTTVLDGVNLEVRAGEFFSLLGPSGCGKTTLLRIISGLETATSGEMYWNDKRIDGMKPQDLPFNMVFQRYALFPHLSVFDNVAFGLKMKNVDASAISPRVEEVLNLVGLWDLRQRMPETLSGGQAQRVAVARAVVNKPQILLLDEPLSALDQKMREHMQHELRELQRRLQITFILVTHDQEEALSLSDRVAVMNRGRIEQISTPRELYEYPQSHFVAQFVGSMGCFKGLSALPAQKGATNDTIQLSLTRDLVLCGRAPAQPLNIGDSHKKYDVFIRPENVRLHSEPNDNVVTAEITNIAFKGLHSDLSLLTPQQQRLRAFIDLDQIPQQLRVGQTVKVYFRPQDTFVFPQAEGLG